jgi:predicted outer membrane repeat protein
MRVTLTSVVIVILTTAALVATGPGVPAMTLIGPHKVQVRCDPAALASAVKDSVNGEVLSLKPSCIYHLTAPLPTLETAIAIAGNSATIEASPAPGIPGFTMLAVDVTAQLAVSDLNFRNAAADQAAFGGAIENDGTLTVTGGSFSGNATTTGFGGAINNTGTLTVTGATFVNDQSADGGAIENQGTATITGSVFRADQASFNGGAIHNEGQLTLTNCWFAGNSAAVSGGGLFNGVAGDLTANGTTFHQNQAIDGGGLDNENSASLTSAVFSGNSASGTGGGILNNWVLSATDSTIVSNSAAGGGGGIYDGDLFGPPGIVTLASSPVQGNHPDNCEPLNMIASCSDSGVPTHPRPAGPHRTIAHTGAQARAQDFYPHPGD